MGIYDSNFDFNKYRTFLAVAECKSFSKATELLHVSQPAISKTIKELEEVLNTKLFIREKKTVRLTENGKKLRNYVQKAFSNILNAEKSISSMKEELSGEIRIGIYSHISMFMLPELISEFTKIHPNVKFNICTSSTKETKRKFKIKELDLLILQYPIFSTDSNYTEEIVCELDNCFFSTKKYYDLYTQNHNNMIDYPLILPIRGYDDIDNLEKMFKEKNMFLKTNLRVYAIELIKELVKEGLGIGWGLKRSIKKELDSKEFYEIPIDFMNPKTKFSLAYDETFLDETTLEFIHFAKEYFKNKKFD